MVLQISGPLCPKIANSIMDQFPKVSIKVVEIVNQYKGGLTIYCAGRLTSLAAVLILYPETIKFIKDIYIMGGAFTVPGNVTPPAEANFYGDPYAVNIVLQTAPLLFYLHQQ
jgi:purine nucleosidase